LRVATGDGTRGRASHFSESFVVADKIDAIENALAGLTHERETLEAEIETMIGDMAGASAEARATGAWAERGASTKRYLDLTERLGEVEQAIIDLTRQRAAAAPPPTKH
jgi:hypothetical protein